MITKHKILIVALSLLLNAVPTTAQENTQSKAKFYGSMQLWTRYTDLNPGSTIDAKAVDGVWDLSVRRYRLGVKGQISEHISYNLQIGNNSLNKFAEDIPPKLLDAHVDFQVNQHLTITGGKHAWIGLSRYAAPSTFSAIGTDITYHATPFLNIQDDLFRKMGIAMHGQAGGWDYRLVIAKPFSGATAAPGPRAQFIDHPEAVHTSGYLKYQFLDREAQTSPFAPWTYHGKKQLFNIGAGFLYQTKSTSSITGLGDTLVHAAKSIALDAYYERKYTDRSTLTLYGVWIRHDLGPDYVRNLGVNNPASGTGSGAAFNGKGNSFPAVGTGDILFANAAFLREFKTPDGKSFGIQPYLSMQYGMLDALNAPMVLQEGGASYLIDGHNSKITLGYQIRPIFVTEGEQVNVSGRKSMVVLQYQVRFQ